MKAIFKKKGMWIAMAVMGVALMTGNIDKTWTAEKKPVRMIMTHEVSTTHFKHPLMLKYAKLLEERSEGRIKGEVYPGGQLYTDRDAIVALGSGSVQTTWPISAQLEQINEGYGILNLPMCLDDEIMMNRRFYGELIDVLSSLVEGRNIRVLGLIRSATGVLCFGKKDILTVDQLKGLKIRVTGGLVCLDWMKDLGATPISMPASEMTTALAQGALDGVMTSPQGWSEIIGSAAKYGLDIQNMWLPTYSALIDRKFWDQQPSDLKKIIQTTFDDLASDQWQLSIAEDKKAFEKLRNVTKVKVTELSRKELEEKWFPKTTPTIAKFKKNNSTAFKKFADLNAKYNRKYPPND